MQGKGAKDTEWRALVHGWERARTGTGQECRASHILAVPRCVASSRREGEQQKVHRVVAGGRSGRERAAAPCLVLAFGHDEGAKKSSPRNSYSAWHAARLGVITERCEPPTVVIEIE